MRFCRFFVRLRCFSGVSLCCISCFAYRETLCNTFSKYFFRLCHLNDTLLFFNFFFWSMLYILYRSSGCFKSFWDMISSLDVEVYFTSHVTHIQQRNPHTMFMCVSFSVSHQANIKNGPLKYILRCWRGTFIAVPFYNRIASFTFKLNLLASISHSFLRSFNFCVSH